MDVHAGADIAAFHLRVTIGAEGRAQVAGEIQRDGDPPTTLLAQDAPAQATCADANGNAIVGLVRLAAMFRDAASGAHVSVVLETREGEDIDTSREYELDLYIGDDHVRLLVGVTLIVVPPLPDPNSDRGGQSDPHRRKRKRRRKRRKRQWRKR